MPILRKIINIFLFALAGWFLQSLCLAAIPKSSMILQRTAENSGRGIYQIEIEAQFPSAQETTVLREVWMIQDSQNMKVQISGMKDYKDIVTAFIQITNGNRSFGKDLRKSSSENWEKYFHSRHSEVLAQLMAQEKIAPATAYLSKPLKSLKDFELTQESFLRLSRNGGVVTYAYGTPAIPEKTDETFPGLWIEQDQFLIRKIRLNSGAELTADKYSSYPSGLNFPKTRTIRWGGQQATLQTLNVSLKNKTQYDNFGSKTTSKPESFKLLPNGAVIEDFYKRFR